jgi:hypothetical protein
MIDWRKHIFTSELVHQKLDMLNYNDDDVKM